MPYVFFVPQLPIPQKAYSVPIIKIGSPKKYLAVASNSQVLKSQTAK